LKGATVRQATATIDVPPLAKRAVLSIAALVAVAQFAASFGGGYWIDEVYMLAIGRSHLDWGSADQPPLTPLLAALMDWIFPGSTPALRVPAVLATAAAVVVAALIAREIGGDRRAQILTAGAQATGLWASNAGHWLTPYTLEPVQWLLLCWLLVRWQRLRDDRLLLAVGLVAGIAAETKFQVLLLCAVLLLSVLVFGPRELLRRPMLWASAGIGVVLALPTLLWQAAYDWPQLRMAPVVASEVEALYGGRRGLAVELVLFAGVAGTVLAVYGLWRLLRADELRAYRYLGVTFLVLYVVFIAMVGRPYYLVGSYGVLAAAGALGLQRRREAGGTRWRWVAWPGYAVSAAVAAGVLVTMSLTTPQATAGAAIARATAGAYHALPAGQREHTAILGQSYIQAAYLDGYAQRYHLPRAYSSHRGYGYFPPPPDTDTDTLYVGSDPGELRRYVTGIRKVVDGGKRSNVWLCTGLREPWSVLWPRLRHLTVS
jgi:4-amino-4-deoxy-L-arabinose transferase-like glycosyltransferase